MREISDACRKFGLKFGVYVSPWDRNSAAYGTPEYRKIFQEQIREVLSLYGPVFEMWFDGANGGDGWYGGAKEKRNIGDPAVYYDWADTFAIVRSLQPDAVTFYDHGPDRRWCGNENGWIEPESRASFTPIPFRTPDSRPKGGDQMRYLNAGAEDGLYFIQPECDFPLRRGWFHHPFDDGFSRTPDQLLKSYLNSVGCGGVMNIGIAPDARGRITGEDAASLRGFRELVLKLREKAVFRFSVTGPGKKTFRVPEAPFNVIELTENIENGERVRQYALSSGGSEILSGRVIGVRRIRVLPEPLTVSELTLDLQAAPDSSVTLQTWLAPREIFEPGGQKKEQVLCAEPGFRLLGPVISGPDPALLTWKIEEKTPVRGFVVIPDETDLDGMPVAWDLLVSADGSSWTPLQENGAFDNVLANPVPQIVRFPAVKAGFIRLAVARTLNGPDVPPHFLHAGILEDRA